MEIDGHKHLLHHTIYHVNKWRTEHLTTKQFCPHRMDGLTTAHLTRESPEDEDTPILSIPLRVTWNPTWMSEATVLTTPSGKNNNRQLYNFKSAHTQENTHITTPAPKTSRGMAPTAHHIHH